MAIKKKRSVRRSSGSKRSSGSVRKSSSTPRRRSSGMRKSSSTSRRTVRKSPSRPTNTSRPAPRRTVNRVTRTRRPIAKTAPKARPVVNARKPAKRLAPRQQIKSRQRARVVRKSGGVRRTRPLPQPPARRTMFTPQMGQIAGAGMAGAGMAGAGAAQNQYQMQIDTIQRRFISLETEAQLGNVYEAVGHIDAKLMDLPLKLDALRNKGYVHSGQFEDRLIALDEQWDEVRDDIEEALSEHIDRLNEEMDETEEQLNRLSSRNRSAITGANAAVNGLERQIHAATSALQGLYGNITQELGRIEGGIRHMEWMMEQIADSPEIHLQEAEGPIAAVEVEWETDGEEGPDGILLLTDQRLLFEQKEEVVTKKFLGLIKTASENVQKLLLDIPIHTIDKVEKSNEGGFMGMGKEFRLNMIFTAEAPLSRATFELNGSDAEEFTRLIKRIQSRDIDNDRADAFAEDVANIEAIAAAFPIQCPSCFAQVPEQPLGVTSTTCEFCGIRIMPELPPTPAPTPAPTPTPTPAPPADTL